MAKFYFKPMPGLSVLLAISVAILIALGAWQYQRLQWKTAVLADVEASVTAPPFASLEEVAQAIANNEPVDFRRIAFNAETIEDAPSYHLYSSQTGGIYWDVIEGVRSGRYSVLAAVRELNNTQKEATPNKVAASESLNITGFVRKSYPMGRVESWVKSQANPAANRYFYFNQSGDWYDGLTGAKIEGYYIDVVEAESAEALPVLRPDIANNHFDYMLTWWSFAFIFIVIYIILHRRAGRLKFS